MDLQNYRKSVVLYLKKEREIVELNNTDLPSLYSLKGHERSSIFEFTITLLTQRSRKVEMTLYDTCWNYIEE